MADSISPVRDAAGPWLPDVDAELPDLFFQVAGLVRKGWLETARGVGLTVSQVRVVRLLERNVDPLKMKDIADHFSISPRAVTDIVDGLIAKGVVRRLALPGDRRVIRVALTPAGVQLLGAIQAARTRSARAVFGSLSEPEREALHRALRRLLQKEGSQ